VASAECAKRLATNGGSRIVCLRGAAAGPLRVVVTARSRKAHYPRDRLENKVSVLAEVCQHLEMGDYIRATGVLDEAYPFVRLVNVGRRYTLPQMVTQFLRDGFVDRFSGDRLIFPPVLRVLSLTMPDRFPFHPNWKMSETHPAYWDLCPTIDHVTPVSLGGADDESKLGHDQHGEKYGEGKLDAGADRLDPAFAGKPL
jgi:hypothetical protein